MTLGYLDAGTGSLILQTVLGGAAGVAVLLKTRGKRLFKRNTDTGDSASDPAAAPVEQSAES